MVRFNDPTHYGLDKVYWNKDINFGNVEKFLHPEPYPYDSIQ